MPYVMSQSGREMLAGSKLLLVNLTNRGGEKVSARSIATYQVPGKCYFAQTMKPHLVQQLQLESPHG